MRSTFRWALLATIATYLLIFTGGLVRVSGAGLGCPDWPQCFGRWIPPTSLSQLPPEVDPSQFNFTLAWIEYLNRLFGVLVGLLILVTALLAIKNFIKVKRILVPSVLAAILVAYTGWQGGQVVQSELESRLVSVHALFAILIACLMLRVTQQLYYFLNPEAESGRSYPAKLRRWLGVLFAFSLLQVLLGTNMRSTVEAFGAEQPLAGGAAWLRSSGFLNYLHMALGVLIALKGIYLLGRVLRYSGSPSPLVWQAAWGLLILMFAQLIFGLLLVFGLSPLLQVLHLWSSALIVGLLLLLYSAAKLSVAAQAKQA